MIIDSLLNDFTWTAQGLRCSDSQKAYAAYKFFRELILDSHLYVTKIVGFHVQNRTMRNHAGTYIARNVQLGESYAEVMSLLSDKLIISSKDSIIKIPTGKGTVSIDTASFSEPCHILYTNPYMCKVVDGNCILNLKTQTNCGYRDMQQNSALLPNEFFPMNTYFNINDYVRILPMMPGETLIKLRLCYGMTIDILKSLVVNYKMLVDQETVHEEELRWLQSFVL